MQKKINHLLTKNVRGLIQKKDFTKILTSNEKLTVYLGVDPSGPIIHLGHAIVLRKLREFQELGHLIILLVGDFTAQIGDPTGKSTSRKPLTKDQVLKNAKSYKEQAAKIVDFEGKNKAKMVFNSTWLEKLSFETIISLAANFTVSQMLERDMFEQRMEKGQPIGLHEFFYPLMQAYDSVALEADVEVGGTDQTFNMLCGRTLRKNLQNQTKHVLTVPLLLGTDGRKMSKSYHNDIGIAISPKEQFGKIMSMKDELILSYFKLCLDLPKEEIETLEKALLNGENPRNLKARLGREIVTLYHGKTEALSAEKEFFQVFKEKKRPTEIPEATIEKQTLKLIDLLVKTGLIESRGEAKRLIKQGAVKIEDEKILDINKKIAPKNGVILQVGKRKFIKIKTK